MVSRCGKIDETGGWTSPVHTAIGRFTKRRMLSTETLRPDAWVAQLVEHVTENHGVGGSIPSPGTTFHTDIADTKQTR